MARRGGFPGGGMPGNMNNLMKQAQRMQRQMEESQKEMETKEFSAKAGGGAVEVTVTGNREVKKVTIDKGYTEILSEKIADYVGADLYRIVPSVPYPEDLDELYIQSRKELNDDYYPEIANKVNISNGVISSFPPGIQ